MTEFQAKDVGRMMDAISILAHEILPMQYKFCFSLVEFEVPVRHPELCVWSSGEKSELEIKSLTEM